MTKKRKDIPLTKLRKVRLEKGISIYQAERDTGYSYSEICKSELGYINQNNSKHKRYDSRTDFFYETMAKYYGVSVAEIKP